MFMTRTLSIYKNGVRRFSGKTDKRGREYGLRLQTKYSLSEFRAWILTQLGGSEEGTVRCAYCGTWLDAGTFFTDHRVPPARGGTLTLENLSACCEPCNNRKGGMTADSWMFIMKCADQLPEKCRRDMFHRLEVAVKLAKKDQARMARDFKSKSFHQPQNLEGATIA